MITVYVLTFNEEFMLPHFIKHYRTMFPGCKIVLYDNESTDSTIDIAKENGCEIRVNDTGGKLNDLRYLEIKNNCWKDAKTDWAWVGDCDELLDFDYQDLIQSEQHGISVIRSEGWNMVNLKDNMDFDSITTGIRAPSYDKINLFNRKAIEEINYRAGCHAENLQGYILYGKPARLRHYKYLNPDFMVKRHSLFASRLSEDNHVKGYGYHYLYTPEQIREEFAEARKNAIHIL